MEEHCNKQWDVKVRCRDRKTLACITDAVNKQISILIEENSSLSVQEKEKLVQRFKEVYDATFLCNIALEKEDKEEKESTSDSESYKEQRKYFNEDVVPKLDKVIMSVAKKRKHTNRLCREKAIDLSNLTLSHLVKLKIMKNKEMQDSTECGNCDLLDESHSEAALSSSSCLLTLTKSVVSTADKCQRLKTAVHMYKKLKLSKENTST